MVTGKGSAVVNQIRRRIGAETVAGLPEWQLVERFATTGDESAFEAIVARFGPMILGVCRRVLATRPMSTMFSRRRSSSSSASRGPSADLWHWVIGSTGSHTVSRCGQGPTPAGAVRGAVRPSGRMPASDLRG